MRLSRRSLLAVGAGMLAAPRLARGARPVLFGLTPVFLDSDIQLIAEIERYLSRKIGLPVQLVKRRTYQEISSLLLANQLDAAWICGFPFVQHRAQMNLIAVPLYRKAPLYRSYLIARSDRAADGIDALQNDIHAFSDPDSNSGFLVTRALLAARRQDPAAFFSRSFFTFGHRNVIRAVAAGLAHSGSVDGYVWDVMREIEPPLVSATRIVRISEPMGFPPIASNRGIDPGLDRAIRDALVEMALDPAGRAILETLRLDGFVPGQPELYAGIADMWRQVQETG